MDNKKEKSKENADRADDAMLESQHREESKQQSRYGNEESKEIDVGDGGNLDPAQFINHGLQRWEIVRAKWVESKNQGAISTASSTGTCSTDATMQEKFSAIPLEVDDVIDVIFAPRWRNPGAHEGAPECFPKAVPLPQMVDILVDLWEAEGLDV